MKTEKNPGWENRVEGLKMKRDIAKHINDISKAENISNLFLQYNNILEELKNKKQLDENGSFTYEDYEEKSKEITLPTPYQWCNNCVCLCCQIYAWP